MQPNKLKLAFTLVEEISVVVVVIAVVVVVYARSEAHV